MKLLLALVLPSLFFAAVTFAADQTGMEGVISISPTHGGPIKVGEPDSKPAPNVEFVVKKGDEVVASFTTDSNGAFRISLPPGEYAISRKNTPGGIGRFDRHPVQVTAGEMKKVAWTIDSGMR